MNAPTAWDGVPVVAHMDMPLDLHKRSKDGALIVAQHGTNSYSVIHLDLVPVSFTRDEWHTTAVYAGKVSAADAFDIFARVASKRWERLIND